MDTSCESKEMCGFYKRMKKCAGKRENQWLHLYCESKEKSEFCQRKVYHRRKGILPPDDMSPMGYYV
jgi:uncharacterized protein YceH (UPF0502 family)